MTPEEKATRYAKALEKIRDYSGPSFRASQYARTVAMEALNTGERNVDIQN